MTAYADLNRYQSRVIDLKPAGSGILVGPLQFLVVGADNRFCQK